MAAAFFSARSALKMAAVFFTETQHIRNGRSFIHSNKAIYKWQQFYSQQQSN